MAARQRSEIRTTTIRLPRPLYERAKAALQKAKTASGPASLNEFFVVAISSYLKMQARREIDAAFAGMAKDAAYQRQARMIADEFEHSDWEALRLQEEELAG